jgi:hypothetical protein
MNKNRETYNQRSKQIHKQTAGTACSRHIKDQIFYLKNPNPIKSESDKVHSQ